VTDGQPSCAVSTFAAPTEIDFLVHRCWRRQCFDGAKDVLPEFPKFEGTFLCSKLSPYKFSVAVDYSSTLTN